MSPLHGVALTIGGLALVSYLLSDSSPKKAPAPYYDAAPVYVPPATVAHVPDPAPQAFVEDPKLLVGASRHVGKIGASNGLSSIEIDNTSGSEDVEVRFYRDDRKPHVRAMVVKAGQTFVSKGITAGAYSVRWRVLRTQRVYEADQMADLKQLETSEGTRFSRVRMTLYTVPGGNMSTTEVAGEKF